MLREGFIRSHDCEYLHWLEASKTCNGRQTFTRKIQDKDIQRFKIYSSRVQILEVQTYMLRPLPYASIKPDYFEFDDDKFLHVMAFSKRAFPKLHSLFLCDNPESWLKNCSPLFSEHLKTLRLSLHGSIPYFPVLGDSAKQVTKLILSLDSKALSNSSVLETSLPAFLSSFKGLVDLQVDRFSLRQKSIEILSTLSHLRFIRTPHKGEWQKVVRSGLQDNTPSPAFKDLEVFFWEGNAKGLTRLLNLPGAFIKLTVLDVIYTTSNNPADNSVADFIQAISYNCHELQKLYLRGGRNTSKKTILNFEGLRPLSNLVKIEELLLDQMDMIDVTDAQLIGVIKHARYLKELSFLLKGNHRNQPSNPITYSHLTLNLISLLSESCPQLQKLSFPVDGAVTPAPSVAPVFHKLQILFLHHTILIDPATASIYLSMLLPDSCDIKISCDLYSLYNYKERFYFEKETLQLLRKHRAQLSRENDRRQQTLHRDKVVSMENQIRALEEELQKAKDREMAARVDAERLRSARHFGANPEKRIGDFSSSADEPLALKVCEAYDPMVLPDDRAYQAESVKSNNIRMHQLNDKSALISTTKDLEAAKRGEAIAKAEVEQVRRALHTTRNEREKAKNEAMLLRSELAMSTTEKLNKEISVLYETKSAIQVSSAERRKLEGTIAALTGSLIIAKEENSRARAEATRGKEKAKESIEDLSKALKESRAESSKLNSQLAKVVGDFELRRKEATSLSGELESARSETTNALQEVGELQRTNNKLGVQLERAITGRWEAEKVRNALEDARRRAEAERDDERVEKEEIETMLKRMKGE